MPIADLPLALRKIADPSTTKVPGRYSLAFEELCEDLLQNAWEHLETAGVFESFCSAVWAQVKCFKDVLPDDGKGKIAPNGWERRGEEERWRLIDALAATRPEPEDLRLLMQVDPSLLFPRDFHPLLQRAQQAASPEDQARWAELAAEFFSVEDPTHGDAAVKAAEQHAPIAHAFSWLLESGEAGSPEGHPERRPKQEARPEDQLLQRCEELLPRVEGGDAQCWPELVDVLARPRLAECDLFAPSQHWHSLPVTMQERLARARSRFLRTLPPAGEPWLRRGGQIPWEDWSGYAAFMLLARMEPALMDSIPESVWRSWASLIMVAPRWESDKENALRRSVVARVSRHAPVVYLWIEHHGGPRRQRGEARPWDQEESPRDLHSIQGSIWDALRNQASREACQALERLNQEVPGQALLRLALIHAQGNFRSETWQPPGPRELLGRLQRELHGETPALEFLWNEWKQEGEPVQFKPKKENQLSDWIKRHLMQDLSGRRIVVNREVEIRPTEPLRSGQRTDLLVQAIAPGAEGRDEAISVIIEVKGCWNVELWTAMREQLVGRYLAENACQHGIYLVGWYACSHWDETRAHPSEGRVSTQDRARQLLEGQARALSQGNVRVRSFVLDAAFRVEREAPPARRRQ